MALFGNVLEALAKAVVDGKSFETVREIDLTIGEVPVKGTVKTVRKLV